MLGSKGILTPLIPDCSVLRTLTILKNIRNSLIFLRKMATYSCFGRSQVQKVSCKQACVRFLNFLPWYHKIRELEPNFIYYTIDAGKIRQKAKNSNSEKRIGGNGTCKLRLGCYILVINSDVMRG